jgi:hypothetical protein
VYAGFLCNIAAMLRDRIQSTFCMLLNLCCYTRWFKYDQDDLCVNKSQFVPVIFEPPCIMIHRLTMCFNYKSLRGFLCVLVCSDL